MEGCYLLEISKIKIYRDKKKVSLEELVKICREEYHNFDKKYLVYKDFREKNMLLTQALNSAVILQYTIEDQVLIMRHT
uniref:tRNA splicing endonuclease n=1 Tax=uncultured marine thaumarchaeote SAT1000_06_F08 TaxID=1456362 RepID=A0A075I7R8_9ARCH|nr:tRNA splicing endonuclease [uncultured marine thaumarchaeote SAT1000_06_F08]